MERLRKSAAVALSSLLAASQLLSVAAAFGETSAGPTKTTVALGEIVESEHIEVRLPTSILREPLKVLESRGSCSCIRKIGIKTGDVVDPAKQADFPVSLNLAGYRGPLNVHVAAQCEIAGKQTFVIWDITATVRGICNLRKFYDLGSITRESAASQTIEFNTTSEVPVSLGKVRNLEEGSVHLQELGAGKYRLALSFDTSVPGMFSADIEVLTGKLSNKAVLVWEVADPVVGNGELIINPAAVGEWAHVGLPFRMDDGERLSGVHCDDKEIQFRLHSKDDSTLPSLECLAAKPGSKAGKVRVALTKANSERQVELSYSTYFLSK